jgi:hypothetical protein
MGVEEVIEENKLSLVRKYGLEVLVIALLFAVVILFHGQSDNATKIEVLQTEMKTYLKDDRKILIETVEENTATLKAVQQTLNNK